MTHGRDARPALHTAPDRLTIAQAREALGLPATDTMAPVSGVMSELETAAFVGMVRAAVEFAAQFVDRLGASR